MLDSHHHLWRYNPTEYPWIPAASPLARDHLLPELHAATDAAEVTGTIAVQARQTLEENDFLLSLADSTERILGVVGWVPLVNREVVKHLDHFAAHRRFVGVRHVLQDEPDDFFLRDDLHRGLSLLPSHDLRYDLLIYQRQLPVALQLVDRHPDLPIILDHIAKPEVRPGRIESDWRKHLRELAKRDHLVGVKFSGLATEFPADAPVDPATIRAYFEESLNLFGADRLMFGTDWPVCLLRLGSYAQWAAQVRDLVSSLSEDEQLAILSENARRAYALP